MPPERPGEAARNRRALLFGAPVIGLLLLYLLVHEGSGGGAAQSSAPLPDPEAPIGAATLPAGPIVQVDTPATVAPPGPVMQVPVQAVAVQVAATGPDPSQFHLFGLLSSGAVIGMADGSQHFVRIGREVAPGIVLRGVDVHHAILATPSGEIQLGFDAGPQPQAPVRVTPSGTPPRP
jgi:hypothetical protein